MNELLAISNAFSRIDVDRYDDIVSLMDPSHRYESIISCSCTVLHVLDVSLHFIITMGIRDSHSHFRSQNLRFRNFFTYYLGGWEDCELL